MNIALLEWQLDIIVVVGNYQMMKFGNSYMARGTHLRPRWRGSRQLASTLDSWRLGGCSGRQKRGDVVTSPSEGSEHKKRKGGRPQMELVVEILQCYMHTRISS